MKPTILVVDDEKPIRDLIRLNLENEGYRVLEANDGREALEIALAPDSEVEILITDILMPYMNGKDLATRISSARPQIKVLFVSAYSADILTSMKLCPPGSDYIRKPFQRKELLSRLEGLHQSSRVWTAVNSGLG